MKEKQFKHICLPFSYGKRWFFFLVGSLFLLASCLSGGGGGGGSSSGSNPDINVEFNEISTTKSESDITTFTVDLTADITSDGARTVYFRVSGGNAVDGADFTITRDASGDYSATFAPGSLSASISLDISNDSLDEDDETFILSLIGTSSIGIGSRSQHTVTITDDDALPAVDLDSATGSGNEADTVNITFTLNPVSGRDVTLSFTATGSGVDPAEVSDYTLASSSYTIPEGETTGSISLSLADDDIDENDETLEVSFTATNATAGTSSTTITITDDDNAPTVSIQNADGDNASSSVNEGSSKQLSVVLSHGSELSPTVDLAISPVDISNYTLTGGGNLTFGSAETSKNITVVALDDLFDEADQTADITLSNVSNLGLGSPATHRITIIDTDDPPTASFLTATQTLGESSTDTVAGNATVQLSTASRKAVSIPFTLGGTATEGTDYSVDTASPLMITAGDTSADIDFTIAVDNSSDLNTANLTAIFTLGSGDTFATNSNNEHTLTINEFLNGVPEVSLSISNSSVDENLSLPNFTVELSNTYHETITIPYSINDAEALAGEDYVDSDGSVSITAGNTTATFSVSLMDDSLDEENETFVVELGSPTTNNANLSSQTSVTITINDDDPEPTVGFNQASDSGLEGADAQTNQVSVAVSLSEISGRNVTVDYALSGSQTATAGVDFSGLTGGTLSIPAGTQSAAITFDISGDDLNEQDETVILNLSNPNKATLGGNQVFTYTIKDEEIEISLDWVKNRERLVNSEGGFYRVYYSTVNDFTPTESTPYIEIAYESDIDQTIHALDLIWQKSSFEVTYYFKVRAYITVDGTTYSSELSDQTSAVIPAQD